MVDISMDVSRGWHSAYEKAAENRLWDEEPISFLPPYIEYLAAAGVRTVTDIGCGEGRS